jgi:hypothetical protein
MRFRNLFVFLAALLLAGCFSVARVSDDRLQAARDQGMPVVFTWIRPSPPNSAGGVDAHVYFVNTTDQQLRYVRIDVGAYNAVGDAAPSTISRRHVERLQAVGPFEPGRGNGNLMSGAFWENVWYNNSIACIKVERVEVEFMDRSKKVIQGDDIFFALTGDVTNQCP